MIDASWLSVKDDRATVSWPPKEMLPATFELPKSTVTLVLAGASRSERSMFTLGSFGKLPSCRELQVFRGMLFWDGFSAPLERLELHDSPTKWPALASFPELTEILVEGALMEEGAKEALATLSKLRRLSFEAVPDASSAFVKNLVLAARERGIDATARRNGTRKFEVLELDRSGRWQSFTDR